jgi:hypothetical protein
LYNVNNKNPNNLTLKCPKNLNRHFPKKDMKMTNQYVIKDSTSLLFRKRQIRAIIRHHFILIGMGIIKNTRVNKCWCGYGEQGILYTAGRNVMGTNVMGNSRKRLQKI